MKRSAFTVIEVLVVLAIIATVGTIIFGVILKPHFEARAYNRLTGANVSYWDAVWLDLRVIDSPQQTGHSTSPEN